MNIELSKITAATSGMYRTQWRDICPQAIADIVQSLTGNDEVAPQGITVPMVVGLDESTGKHYLIDGFHRYSAAKQYGLNEVPVVITAYPSFAPISAISKKANSTNGRKVSGLAIQARLNEILLNAEEWSYYQKTQFSFDSKKLIANYNYASRTLTAAIAVIKPQLTIKRIEAVEKAMVLPECITKEGKVKPSTIARLLGGLDVELVKGDLTEIDQIAQMREGTYVFDGELENDNDEVSMPITPESKTQESAQAKNPIFTLFDRLTQIEGLAIISELTLMNELKGDM